MKNSYSYLLIVSILFSCATPYKFKHASLEQKKNILNSTPKENESQVFVSFPNIPNLVKDEGSSTIAMACKINNTKAFIIDNSSFTKVNLKNGKHQMTCQKVYSYESKENMWTYYRKPKGIDHTISFELKKDKYFEVFPASPIITEVSLEKSKKETFFASSNYLTPEIERITIEAPIPNKKYLKLNSMVGTSVSKPVSKKAEERTPATKESNVVEDCASYIAAKKACDMLPFGSSICISGVNSRYDRTLIAVCSKF